MGDLILGDAIEEMAKLESERFECVFADYPFDQDRLEGYDDKHTSYREWTRRCIEQFYRLLKPGGNLVVLNTPVWTYASGADYLEAGFLFRSVVPLVRPGAFSVKNHLWFKHNVLAFLAKEHKDRWYQEGRLTDVWDDLRYQAGFTSPFGRHPQAVNEDVVERALRLVTQEGDEVLDPFMGSGTTAAVCIRLDRRWVGIDNDPAHIQIAEWRIARAERDRHVLKTWRIDPSRTGVGAYGRSSAEALGGQREED